LSITGKTRKAGCSQGQDTRESLVKYRRFKFHNSTC